ncbi:MAG: DedA family protein [Armatimonadetes bacterium]|nr:DedA family protein [Armatimonadota bacterium]
MIHKLLAPVIAWTTGTIAALGYLGIVLMMAIESACIPLPSEIIMPFGGYLVSQNPEKFSLIGMAVAGALGCVLGSWLAYWVGYFGGRPFVYKYGRYLLVRKRDVDAADRFFDRWGDWAIFISRLLPVVRTVISLPAGISRMRFWHFTVYTFLGSLPWCYALAWAGHKLGDRWEDLKRYFQGADVVVLVVFVCAVAFWVWHHLRPEEPREKAA